MATTNTQAVPLRTKRGISAGSIFSAIGRWIVRNRIYLIAFAIPAALTYLASVISSALQLLRLILLSSNNRRRD